ncbi:hypothetical protein [Weissella cibaria]|uniref:hypothetical protein n=1 Tax=Weissella cibaria TaxID=137591 RepID=UPI0018986EC9|nr:hypothetical protein [Weissella cibaria]
MNALIYLRNEKRALVSNISKIIRHKGGYSEEEEIIESSDFDSFQIFDYNYTFVGNETVAISGADILYVSFSN